MPEFGLWLFALVVICHPLVPWATGLGSSAAPEGPEEASPLSRRPGTVGQNEIQPLESVSVVKSFQAQLHLLCSCFPPPGHSLGSAKVSRAQTFPSYPSEQGEEHQQPLSLGSSYAFSYSSGLVQWQPGLPHTRTLEPGASHQDREPLAPLHPPFAVKTDARQLQLGLRQCGNLERRLPPSRGWVFIYLFCRSFCWYVEKGGGWGLGGGNGDAFVL